MSKPRKTGLRRIWKAMFYSLQGITVAWQHEAAFRQEAVLSIILIPLAFLVGDSAVERALLAGSCLLVLVTELLNSAIEATVDRIGSDQHELSGRAKDMGSAAVFISLCTVGLTWGLIGYERFLG
ncbi:MAG: diacylglycerol kinase [Gammaproteobacteria bacterium]|jgi:diacylglycerol kinase (ATP)